MKKGEYEKMFSLENTHFWFVGKRYFADSYIKTLKNIGNILDIGSGTGGMTKFLEKYGHVTGLEKNEYARNLAKRRKLNIIPGVAENLPFKKNSFDLITIFDVLYHKNVGKVERVIAESARVVRSGGYILITDSAFGFLKGRHHNAVGEKRRFSIGELTSIMKRSGIYPMRSSYIYFSIFPLVFMKRRIIDSFFYQKGSDVSKLPYIVNHFLSLLLLIESIILKYLSMPIGSSLIILGRKK